MQNIIKKYLTNGQYKSIEYPKTQLYLHHTAGTTANGAWQWWNQTPERVGAAYIIDRDGTIIECFDPKYMAWHLGTANDGDYGDMHGIAIEIVSAGQLHKEQDGFYFYPLYPKKIKGIKIPENQVVELDEEWRGSKYYQKYTEEQYRSLEYLIPLLIKRFPGIKLQSNNANWWEFSQEVINKRTSGIYSHSTVRRDKSDIIPYEQFLQVIKGIFALISNKRDNK